MAYTESERTKVVQRAEKVGITRAAEESGVAQSTVSVWVKRYKSRPAKEEDCEKDMKIAGLQAEIDKLKEASVDDPAALWAMTERTNAKLIERSQSARQVEKVFPGDRYTAIAFISDQHISEGEVDLRRMRLDAELIAATDDVWAMLGGDGVDLGIGHRAAMIMSNMNPSRQWELYRYYLNIFATKVVALVGGNHDLEWTIKAAGIDPIYWLANNAGIKYVADEIRLTAHAGRQTYKIAMRHKYTWGSRLNMGHAVRRWAEFGHEPFSVGVICHHHEPSVDCFRRHGKEVWAIRPGSYSISSGYSRMSGFSDTVPSCPTIILSPDKDEIIAFSDLRQGVKVLKALNG